MKYSFRNKIAILSEGFDGDHVLMKELRKVTANRKGNSEFWWLFYIITFFVLTKFSLNVQVNILKFLLFKVVDRNEKPSHDEISSDFFRPVNMSVKLDTKSTSQFLFSSSLGTLSLIAWTKSFKSDLKLLQICIRWKG